MLKNQEKSVDISGKSDIIEEKEMLPRKSRTGNFAVDWEKVQSEEYSSKFRKLSDNEKISSAIERRAKWALNNCDDMQSEELYAVSLKSGSEIARITNQNYTAAVKRTKEFTKKLNKADMDGDNILLLHNHPRGLRRA